MVGICVLDLHTIWFRPQMGCGFGFNDGIFLGVKYIFRLILRDFLHLQTLRYSILTSSG